MATQCTSNAFPLAGLGRRQVVAKFDGGRLCSDGGAVLLRAANQAFQVTGRLAACFIDHRNPARVEHSLESLLGQRVFALALGYEDINDHDRLRDDSLLALDGPDLTGQSRRRERDRGHALAGSSHAQPAGVGYAAGGRRGPLQEGRGEHGTDRRPAGGSVPGHARDAPGADRAGRGGHRRSVARPAGGSLLSRLLPPLLLPAAVHHVRRACAVCAPADGAGGGSGGDGRGIGADRAAHPAALAAGSDRGARGRRFLPGHRS